MKRFDYADTLLLHIRACGLLPVPTREYQPFPDRRYRLDLAWPHVRWFVECDGGEFLRAVARRHGGPRDCERWNDLMLAGWRGLRFTGSQVTSGRAIHMVAQLFGCKV